MNHIHVSFLTVLTWIFTGLVVIPAWRLAAIMLREKPIGQALAFDGFGF